MHFRYLRGRVMPFRLSLLIAVAAYFFSYPTFCFASHSSGEWEGSEEQEQPNGETVEQPLTPDQRLDQASKTLQDKSELVRTSASLVFLEQNRDYARKHLSEIEGLASQDKATRSAAFDSLMKDMADQPKFRELLYEKILEKTKKKTAVYIEDGALGATNAVLEMMSPGGPKMPTPSNPSFLSRKAQEKGAVAGKKELETLKKLLGV
jgi:hypothetical protein